MPVGHFSMADSLGADPFSPFVGALFMEVIGLASAYGSLVLSGCFSADSMAEAVP
jgi:hypothetical protein